MYPHSQNVLSGRMLDTTRDSNSSNFKWEPVNFSLDKSLYEKDVDLGVELFPAFQEDS